MKKTKNFSMAKLQHYVMGGQTMIQTGQKIENPQGKLGVLMVGLGAVSTTFVTGVLASKKGQAKPLGGLERSRQ